MFISHTLTSGRREIRLFVRRRVAYVCACFADYGWLFYLKQALGDKFLTTNNRDQTRFLLFVVQYSGG